METQFLIKMVSFSSRLFVVLGQEHKFVLFQILFDFNFYQLQLEIWGDRLKVSHCIIDN